MSHMQDTVFQHVAATVPISGTVHVLSNKIWALSFAALSCGAIPIPLSARSEQPVMIFVID